MDILGELRDYEAVRKALDLSLSETDLPDETIMLPIFQGWAEQEMLERDPRALDYAPEGTAPDTGKWLRVRNAAIFLCAAALAPSLPVILSEQAPDNYRLTVDKWDPVALSARLLGKAAQEIAAYQAEGGTIPPLSAMHTVKGRCVRYPLPTWYRRVGI